MIAGRITYGPRFVKQFVSLPVRIKKIAAKKVEIFKQNPIHPSLRLHSLRGKLENIYSISVTMSYRIIFKRQENGDLVFISIGKHDIYKSL